MEIKFSITLNSPQILTLLQTIKETMATQEQVDALKTELNTRIDTLEDAQAAERLEYLDALDALKAQIAHLESQLGVPLDFSDVLAKFDNAIANTAGIVTTETPSPTTPDQDLVPA